MWVSCTLTFLFAQSTSAQDPFKFSGLLYSDYSYVLQSPVQGDDGTNGFGYRRIYFTADYTHSERFSGRFRLEAADNSTTEQGKPAPFVKDLYLRWNGALGEGHSLILGVSGTPVFEVSEKVWGYRSLLKALQDRGKVVSSRDMGVALKGQLTPSGSVRYGLMVANNEGVSRETDKHKRVYGQLEFYPSDVVSLTLGGDFASFENGHAVNVNGFAGYSSEGIRFGAEAYLSPRSYDDLDDKMTRQGATIFVVAQASANVSGIVRVDRTEENFLGDHMTTTMLLVGLGIQVESGIEIIPNFIVEKDSELNDPMVTGRITLFVSIK